MNTDMNRQKLLMKNSNFINIMLESCNHHDHDAASCTETQQSENVLLSAHGSYHFHATIDIYQQKQVRIDVAC